ncbi:TPA: hypothetical protein R5237_000670 [Enterobacter kobei]|nr:hypothetical protein [Enterobacter kobei]
MSNIDKQWLQQKIAEMEEHRDLFPGDLDDDHASVLSAFRIALASLEAEPVGTFRKGPCGYSPSFHEDAVPLYTAPPAPVSVPDEIYAELYQLREEVKGPDGFNTWRDAATAEKVLRLSMGRDALRYRFLRDKDAFGDENEHGLASWDDLAEMEYNEFDAAVDARMNDSDMPLYIITQGKMVENDVAASEKKASNERYKQISDIDYLGAMSAFHSDKWHKMGPITGYMHGWNACRAAMLHGADGNSPVITDAYEIEAFGVFSATEGEGGLMLQIENFRLGTENCPQIGKENMVPKFALQAIINRLQDHCNSMGNEALVDILLTPSAPQQEVKP